MLIDYAETDKGLRYHLLRALSLSGTIALSKDRKIDIVLTVNGVEVDFLKFADSYVVGLDKEVEDKAREIVKEKYDDLMNTAYELTEQIKRKITD